MEWIEQAAFIWHEWILLSLPGAVIVYIFAEILIRYGKFLSSQLRYWLLLGVLIKCVMPPLFWIPLPVLTPEPEPVIQPGYERVVYREHVFTAPIFPQHNPVVIQEKLIEKWEWYSWQEFIFLLQIIGTVLILLVLVFKLSRLSFSRLRMNDEEIGALCGRLCVRMGMRIPRLYLAPNESGACASGLFSPYIVVPRSLLYETTEYQSLVLMHELIHIQRKDHVINWLQVGVFVLFWWHPIVWRVNYLIRCEREHCCDEQVLKELAIAPMEYTKLLVDAAEKQILHNQFHWQTAFANPAHAFQNRIRRIVTMNHITKKYTWIGLSLVGLLITTTICGLQFVEAQQKQQDVTLSIEELDQVKYFLNLLSVNGEEIPDELLDSVKELSSKFNLYLSENYTNRTIEEMRSIFKLWETRIIHSSLDYKMEVAIDETLSPLYVVLDNLKECLSQDEIDRYNLTFVYGKNVNKEDEIIYNTRGKPTIRHFLDRTLPPIGLGYIEIGNGEVLVYKEDEKTIFKEESRKSKLDTVIPVGMHAPNVPLKDIFKLLKSQTGLQYELGDNFGDIRVNFSLSGIPNYRFEGNGEEIHPDFVFEGEMTIRQLLYSILPSLDLAYLEEKDGSIFIIKNTTTKQSRLDSIIRGGIQAPDTPLEDVFGLLRVETGLNYVLGQGIGGMQVAFNYSGNPTIRQLFDSILPLLDLDYLEQTDGTVWIDRKEKIKEAAGKDQIILKKGQPKTISTNSILYKTIPGGVHVPDVPLEDVLELIQAQTGAQLIFDPEIGDKRVSLSIQGDPSLKLILENILYPLGLQYTVREKGVILIDNAPISPTPPPVPVAKGWALLNILNNQFVTMRDFAGAKHTVRVNQEIENTIQNMDLGFRVVEINPEQKWVKVQDKAGNEAVIHQKPSRRVR